MSRRIVHQTQPCPISCVSTCLAMLKGAPARQVVEQLNKRYHETNISMREMLDELQIPFQSFDSCDRSSLYEPGAYLCQVPSLNNVGGTHQILIEITDSDDLHVIDPVAGRPELRYYVPRGKVQHQYQVELGGFTVMAFIAPEWLETRATA